MALLLSRARLLPPAPLLLLLLALCGGVARGALRGASVEAGGEVQKADAAAAPTTCRDRPMDDLTDDSAKGMSADQVLGLSPPPFGPGFVWGAATSAYQVEGAVAEDGRGASIWDTYSHASGQVKNNETGDVACDHYRRFKDDVKLIKSLGHTHYRFSIAWPRIMPNGTRPVNEAGVQFYKDLVAELKAAGVEPAVTLYHWDLPQALQDKGGWEDPSVVDAFADFADVMFAAIGDDVKMWFTINEPWSTAILGHGLGSQAPGLKDIQKGVYMVGHHQLLSHAAAAKIYKTKYQATQKGQIGIVLSVQYKEPLCTTAADASAAERNLQFYLGWFAAPLFKGDYPPVMRERAGARLPEFTEAQKADLLASSDFMGLNTYSSSLVTNKPVIPDPSQSTTYWQDISTINSYDPNWPRAESSWLYVVPVGMRKVLRWIKAQYGDVTVYITENGVSVPGESQLTGEAALQDDFRVNYLKLYIAEVAKAVAYDGVDVRGFFVWSLMDNFEWSEGYATRFGLVRVDFQTQERMAKKSALWYKDLIMHFRAANATASAIQLNP